MPAMPAIPDPTATAPWSVGPFQPVSFHRLRDAFCCTVGSRPRLATGFSSDIPDIPSIPPMSMPMSVMVRSVRGAERRDWGDHALAWCQGRASHAGTVDRFRHEAVGAVAGRHDHVERLGDPYLELVHFDGPDVLAIGLHDRHRQVRDSDVEVGLRRGVDDAQPNPLPRPEETRPVVIRPKAIDQEGVGRTRDVRDVRRVHPHLPPSSGDP